MQAMLLRKSTLLLYAKVATNDCESPVIIQNYRCEREHYKIGAARDCCRISLKLYRQCCRVTAAEGGINMETIPLNRLTVKNNVAKKSIGCYRLGDPDHEGNFVVGYIGRSTRCLNKRLLDHASDGQLFDVPISTPIISKRNIRH